MVPEKKKGLACPMLGFMAVSFFLLMLILAVLDYPGWVLGETLVTDVIDSDSTYFMIGGAVGGLLLAFSAVGKSGKGRPGRIGEGLFIILTGIFIVWAAIFNVGDKIYEFSVLFAFIAFILAMLSSLYDDFDQNRHMGFGSLTILILVAIFSMCVFMEPEVYQIGTLISGIIWILIRSVRELYA